MIISYVQTHWKSFSTLVLACGLAWIGLTSIYSTNTTQGLVPAPRQGFLAPDFTLQDMAGNQVSLQSLRGKVVVVNIWTTWCAFCKSEMPAFQKVFDSFQPDSGAVILAVNSTIQDDPVKVAQFVKDYGLRYPILLDASGRTTAAYQVRALPTTFFIDRNGIIQNVTIGGPLTEVMIQTQITSMLSQVP